MPSHVNPLLALVLNGFYFGLGFLLLQKQTLWFFVYAIICAVGYVGVFLFFGLGFFLLIPAFLVSQLHLLVAVSKHNKASAAHLAHLEAGIEDAKAAARRE